MVDLSRLLRPESVAIIGGGAWGRHVVRNLATGSFEGRVWPVHLSDEVVEGQKAFHTPADLPDVPDAAYVAVNRRSTVDTIAELAAMGCGGAVCFASGFLEAEAEDGDAAELQHQLLAAAGDMTIIGPNCYGFLNYLDGATLWPDQHGGRPVDRGVAIISQSSNMALNISMQRRGLPIGYLATVGNQAQTGMSDLGIGLLEDPRVSALGMHIEGIDSLRAMEALARRARELNKPIVVLKVGKSEMARKATISHTASLSGSEAGSTALFRRLGFGQVHSLPAFLETLKLLHVVGPLASSRIASVSCSGGEASLIADMAVARQLTFPELRDEQTSGLRSALGPMVALSNPLDYHTYIWRNPEKIAETFAAVMQGDLSLGVAILDFPRDDRCDPNEWMDVVSGTAKAARSSGKPMAIAATLHECMPEDVCEIAISQGVAPIAGLDEALTAIECAAWLGKPYFEQPPVILPGADRATETVYEVTAKEMLAQHGLLVPRGQRADSVDAAIKAASAIGYPVVLKALGHAHKSERGAVAVGLKNGDQVRTAGQNMNGELFVEEMVLEPLCELLVGVVRDPAHGFVLTLGAGGVLAELLTDTASLLLPAKRQSIDRALNELKVAGLLKGFRGRPAADWDAVLDAIQSIASYVEANADRVDEVEVNPLIASARGAIAADALIRQAPIR